MWDGRDTLPGQPITASLALQANNANMLHAQATQPLSLTQAADMVAFQTMLFTAQITDTRAANLATRGGMGGPVMLSSQPFYLGINDAFGGDPNENPFNPQVFDIFAAWNSLRGARASVAHGEQIFDTRSITITGVAGLNDVLGVPVFVGTCSTCHDAPNAGSHSMQGGGFFD